MNKIFIFLLLLPLGSGQPCEDSLSVELTNATFYLNGSVLHENITYSKEFVYNKNVSYYVDDVNEVVNETKTFGCLCKVKTCVAKCCPFGFYKTHNACVENPKKDIILNEGLNLYNEKTYHKTVNISFPEFARPQLRENGTPFCETYKLMEPWYIQQDGQLYIDLPSQSPPWELHGPDKYCIDTFVHEETNGEKTYTLDALVCFGVEEEEHDFLLNSSCMLISCVFIMATCAVYAWLPELCNLHGRVLMAYLLSLFVAFLFMATMQILSYVKNTSLPLCNVLTFIIYFAFQSAFFWLNVMCFDIWWTFSGKRGLSLEKLSTRARFKAYAAYAFGCPTVLTILLAILEFADLNIPPQYMQYLPLLRIQGCFLYGTSRMIYLYGPMTFLCIINIIFFVLTAIKIVQIKIQTAVLKNKESSSTHDNQRNNKQRLYLYFKLFIVMGINWILEVISAYWPDVKYLWKITDVYNVLIGFTIFVIFVCKRKIYKLIKKRYKQVRGDPMSRNHTTMSSRTTSTKDDFQMGSIKIDNK